MIQLWHGGNRWEGDPEVRAPKQGRYECGPGIYLSTSYLRARKYAGGGKVTTLVTLADTVRWLEKAKLPLRELAEFIDTAPRLPGREGLRKQLLDRNLDRGLELHDLCPVDRLVNLLINEEALAGKMGVYLAQWLASKGVDASLHKPMGQEQWVIVFNPAVIRKHTVMPASKIDLALYDLPQIELPAEAV